MYNHFDTSSVIWSINSKTFNITINNFENSVKQYSSSDLIEFVNSDKKNTNFYIHKDDKTLLVVFEEKN